MLEADETTFLHNTNTRGIVFTYAYAILVETIAHKQSTGSDQVVCGHCKYKYIERDALYMIHICGYFYPVCPTCGLSKFCAKKREPCGKHE